MIRKDVVAKRLEGKNISSEKLSYITITYGRSLLK